MAGYPSDDDGAANNGFGCRSLHQWEGWLLYAAGYMAPPLVERAWPDARVRPRAHRARQRPRPGDAAAAASDTLPSPRELLDATADGIRLLRLGVLRVGDEVGITVLGNNAEDRQAGTGVRASAQQRRPPHPREGAHRITAAPSQAEEGGRCQGRL
jgi:hypothetical protein